MHKMFVYTGIFTDSLEYMTKVIEISTNIKKPDSRKVEMMAEKALVKSGLAGRVCWNDCYLGTIVGGKLDGEQVYISNNY